MSGKYRNYPVLPVLFLQMPTGEKVECTPVLCSEEAAEMSLTLTLGIDGDQIVHHYTLSLGRMLEKYGPVHENMLAKIIKTYAERVSARIKLDAVLAGADLWLKQAHYQIPGHRLSINEGTPEPWMLMAAGVLRRDQVRLTVDASDLVRDPA